MIRLLFVALGSIFLALGVIGIVVPGLPTTPFLLLSAACYFRSSNRLHSWLLNHKLFGRFIRDFKENKSISLRSKVISLVTMSCMILLSVFVFLDNLYIKIVILILGAVGAMVLLLIPTSRKS